MLRWHTKGETEVTLNWNIVVPKGELKITVKEDAIDMIYEQYDGDFEKFLKDSKIKIKKL